MNGYNFLLNLVLSSVLPNSTTTQIECANQLYHSLLSHTTIIAMSQTPHANQFIHPHHPYIIINQNYKQQKYNPKRQLYHSGVILLQCDEELGPIVDTIKRNRVISVRMRLVVVVTGCTQVQQPTHLLNTIDDTLRPAYSQVIQMFLNSSVSFYYNKTKMNDCRALLFKKRSRKDIKVSSNTFSRLFSHYNSSGDLEGVEVKIVEAIAHDLDITWVKQANRTPVLGFPIVHGMLDVFSIDLGFGALAASYEQAELSEMLYPHTVDYLKWMIPGPPEFQNWGALIDGYTTEIWIMVLVVFIISSLVLTAYQILNNQKPKTHFKTVFASCCFKTWAIVLDQTVDLTSQKVLLLMYTIYSFIITNAYRSSLITSLTAEPRGVWINSPQEAVDAGHITYLIDYSKPHMQVMAKTELLIRNILQDGHHKLYRNGGLVKVILQIAESRNGMTLCPEKECKAIFYSLHFEKNMNTDVIYLDQRRNTYPMVMYVAQGSQFFEKLNKRTLMLIEGGLVEHWVQLSYQTSQTKSAYRFSENSEGDSEEKVNGPQKMTLLHFQSIFTFHLFALLLTTVVLFGEVYIFGR